MLEIKNQMYEIRRKVKKCSRCKQIKPNNEFTTYLYDAIKNKEILTMTRGDDLFPRCKKCQNKIKIQKSENKA